jgi:hypothetical protein
MTMDRLAMESTAAWNAGMSYGRWKAMQTPVIPQKKEPEKVGTWYTCEHCGKRFFKADKRPRKYCDECKYAVVAIGNRERYRRRKYGESKNLGDE